MDKQELIAFEEDIASIYKTSVIKGPIHLRDGNEDILINIFKDIDKDDYKFATWANHLEALLAGIPKEKVKARILEGRSMAMNFPEYKFYTSAIVGGICPIAIGVAWSLKQKEKSNQGIPAHEWDKQRRKVHVFIGDMTLHCGITHESIMYSIYNDLPIKWYVADNHKSVDTPTQNAWNSDNERGKFMTWELVDFYNKLSFEYNCVKCMMHYLYTSKWPHAGVGSFVSF